MKLHEAEQIAKNLMSKHGLTDWTFSFDRAVVRFGCCKYRTKQITLSTKLTELNDETHVENTILHEIAHALVGAGVGHSRTWRRAAQSIGCTATRCYSEEVVTPVLNYVGVCPNGHEVKRVKKPSPRKTSCGLCCPRFNANYLFTFTAVKA
jgi:predicted SprT family Zn-dependent metalloprotease